MEIQIKKAMTFHYQTLTARIKICFKLTAPNMGEDDEHLELTYIAD